MTSKSEQTTSRVPTSHIDIGGIALPRDELRAVLPDLARFEAQLTDALAVDSYMKHGDGSIPGYVQQWSQERIAAVVATLNEIGSLREQVSEQIRAKDAEAARPRDGSSSADASASANIDATLVQSLDSSRHDH